jgi:hypothetical protein
MFEDGIYVSYFSDDENREKDPQSVVVIENAKVNVMLSPNISDGTKAYLNGIVSKLTDSSSKDEYEDIASMYLGKYWEWNGYIPNPSHFFETDSDEASKVLQIARAWDEK